MIWILSVVIFCSQAQASGTFAPRASSFKAPPRRVSPPRPRPSRTRRVSAPSSPSRVSAPANTSASYQSFVSEGHPKKFKHLREYIYNQPHGGLIFKNFMLKEKIYILEGIYEDEGILNQFAETLKRPEHLNKSAKIKRWETRYLGQKTKHFAISSENIW